MTPYNHDFFRVVFPAWEEVNIFNFYCW